MDPVPDFSMFDATDGLAAIEIYEFYQLAYQQASASLTA
jgi:hypothetical protein